MRVLKACPFCGEKKLSVWRNGVMCTTCGAKGPRPPADVLDQYRGAETRWNARAASDEATHQAEADYESEIARLKKRLAWFERLHVVTAQHLSKERRSRRYAEEVVKETQGRLKEANAKILGSQDALARYTTPNHYKGDGITCIRAMESAASQDRVREPSDVEFYLWASAFKYVWRTWSKADPVSDVDKAINCLENLATMMENDNG